MGENNQVTILLVEDEEDARGLYADILSSSGFNVITAVDGQEAEEKIIENNGSIKLVLLDIITPRKDGIQALSEIKNDPAKFGTPKVIMLSNIAGDIAIDKAMDLGADGYMLKTEVEPSDLVNVIKGYLE